MFYPENSGGVSFIMHKIYLQEEITVKNKPSLVKKWFWNLDTLQMAKQPGSCYFEDTL